MKLASYKHAIQCHILLLLLITNALLWIIIICLCLTLLFKEKIELTWKLRIPRPDGRGDGAKSGIKKDDPLVIGRGSDLNPYFYFFVFCCIQDNAQIKCWG